MEKAMNQLKSDWPYVRRYTIIPLASAMLALIVLIAAIWWQERQTELHSQLTANQLVVQEDYKALVDRRRIVARYHQRYQQFSELGFVGMESRLDWIETLRESSLELTLPRVSYMIEPQLTAIAPVESILAGDDIVVHVSKLDLEMNLVHELDLLRFIDELQQKAPGLIKVDHCNLTWQADREQTLTADQNILASCSVEIYSVITADVSVGVSS